LLPSYGQSYSNGQKRFLNNIYLTWSPPATLQHQYSIGLKQNQRFRIDKNVNKSIFQNFYAFSLAKYLWVLKLSIFSFTRDILSSSNFLENKRLKHVKSSTKNKKKYALENILLNRHFYLQFIEI